MDLSIIILNYKNSGLVKQLLKNFYSENLDFKHEIFVVDNNSHDGCVALIQKNFPQVKIIESRVNLGFSAGNNLALKRVQGEFILMLNPDVAVRAEAIIKLFNFIKTHQRVGIVAPCLINPNGSVQDSCYRWPTVMMPIYRRTFLKRLPGVETKLKAYMMKDFDHQQTIPVAWVLGGCMMIRREAMKQVGYLDERFFLYFEDIDWCRRLWERQWQVYYYPDAKMVHYHQRLSAEYDGWRSIFNMQMYWHIASWIKYVAKYWGKKNPQLT